MSTEAGKRLVDALSDGPFSPPDKAREFFERHIAAIEAEAVAAERARIRALDYRMVEWYHADGAYSLVQVVARSEAIGGSADAD